MQKLTLLLLIAVLMFAEVKHIDASTSLVKSGITIIDIRTAGEWRETGIVHGSKTVTFFDENGNYNARAFLSEVEKYVTKDEEFAVICRTGNRTRAVSQFLSEQGYKVINLKGGIRHLIDKEGYKTSPYGK